MRKNDILFSIVITTFDSENTIEKALNSVINQTLENKFYEIIVIDDCSNDNTWEILQSYDEDNLYTYQLEKNSGGPSIPRNHGIYHSSGEYIHFLDGDDWLDLNILYNISKNKNWFKSELIIAKAVKNKNGNQSIYAKFMTINENINQKSSNIPYLYYYLGPSGKFIKRKFIEKNKIQFSDQLPFGGDKLFFLKVFENINYITTTGMISNYINRSSDNISIVKKTNFVQKRKSDIILFDHAINIKKKKRRDEFLLRIVEHDILKNCNSHVFLNLEDQEKKEVFEITKEIFYNEYIRKKIIKNVDYRFKQAIEAIYENDFMKFNMFFEWYKRGAKVLSKNSDNNYSQKSLCPYEFEIISPFANLLNLQLTEEFVYFQIEINNLKDERIQGVNLVSRSNFNNSVSLSSFTLNKGFLTVILNKTDLVKLANGIFNLVIIYDDYKSLSIKYAFTKKMKLNSKMITIYPTIHGNISIKVES